MKTVQKGFTLIELMIVVAIVGILAAIALPAYQDYMVRAKTTEPMAKLDEMKLTVAEFYSSNSEFPTTNASAGFPAATPSIYGKYVQNYGLDYVDASNVKVGVQFGAPTTTPPTTIHSSLEGKWVILEGAQTDPDEPVIWTCSTDAPASAYRYLPSNCRRAGTFNKETS